MKTLVVFDSQYGNTEKIARQIAASMGEYGTAGALPVSQVVASTLEGIELLVIGSPTQAWNSTVAMKNFIAQLKPATTHFTFTAAFDTRVDKPRLLTGSAAYAMGKELKQRGLKLLLKPECFLVTGMQGPLAEGELEHAAEWARELHAEFELRMEPLAAPM